MAKTGVVQTLHWDTDAGITWKAPGLIAGGEISADQQTSIRYGAGGQAAYMHGRMEFRCNAQIEATADTKALILNAFRASYPGGALPLLKIRGGDDVVNFAHADTIINTLRLSGAVDEPLVANIGFMSLSEVETAAGINPIALTSELLPWYGADLTIGGANFKAQGFETNLDNGCQYYGSLDTKAALSKRLPEGITLGLEKVAFSADFLEEQTWDVDADEPGVAIAAVFTYALGAASITGTFANLTRTGPRAMPFERESGLVVWRYQFLGKQGCLVIT